jgi:hypothetical protein
MRSPYRLEARLDELIPPDRRRLHACVLAFSCVILGAALLRAAEAFVEYANALPDTTAYVHARPLALRGSPVVSSSFIFPDPTLPSYDPAAPRIAQARKALFGHPQRSRELLMPVVASGRATPEEVRVLKAACDGLRDRACIDFLRSR